MGEGLVRAVVAARSGGVCERCGRQRAREKHHRQNRSQGGRCTPANIVDLDSDCHRWVTLNPEAAQAEGWSVPRGADPAAVPVRSFAAWPGVDVYLHDDGNLTLRTSGELL